MFEQTFKNIDDVLWKDAGCTSELDYTEQSSWLLFLKYLDSLEHYKAVEAQLEGKRYSYIIEKAYRWTSWAAPKTKDGKLDHNTAMTGDDLRDFVNQQLFPYLHGFKDRAEGPNTIEIWYMCENNRVAVFGGIKGIMHSFSKGDTAFRYHKGHGIIAAGEINSDVKIDNAADALYRDLKWLTCKPERGNPLKAMSAAHIKTEMGFNFWWAKTMKPPFLDKDNRDKLLDALTKCIGKP